MSIPPLTPRRNATTTAAPVSSGLASPRVGVTLFGDFTVSVNGAAIDAARWKFKHPRLLWQMLCLAPGHRLSRDEAAEALWPQAGVQASSNRLYHALHTLRGIFSDAGVSDVHRLVQLQAGTLRLDADVALDVDVHRFEQAVAAARACNGGDAALVLLDGARAVRRGDFAPPTSAGPWFAPYREALLRGQVWVLEQLARCYRADGRIDDAIRALEDLVRAEPSNEAAHRGLMEIYDAQDRPDLMAQQYAACSRCLRRELGIEPSAATRKLVECIGERVSPEAREARAAEPTTSPVRQRFVAPPRVTPLLGREAELDELRRWLLRDQGPRLITITAAGGVGKTRLAAALAEQVQDHFADGVCFVTLGEVQGAAQLAERVCQALGLTSQQPPADQAIGQTLADKHTLLVLDRFEHLLPAAAQLTSWLQAAPKLRIVVTSQCNLKSRAECVYELQPLLARSPQAAVELFAQTARRVGADVDALHDESLILGLCERVGGNALAIELVAAQSACVPVGDLPAALADAPLQFVAGQSPDGESRHASLEATIDWSCSLLAPDEAAALTLASVFAGDFCAEDLHAVFGDLFDEGALHNTLRTLMERHLLVGSIDVSNDGSRRFAMLDAVRTYARRAALADTRWPQVQRQHAWHFHRLAETAWQGVSEGRMGDARSAFQAAAADIAHSSQWLRDNAPLEDCLRGCWQRAALLVMFGSLREAIDSLHEATRLTAESSNEKGQSAWCHYVLSRAEVLAGSPRAAMRSIGTARSLAKGSAQEALLSHRLDRELARHNLGQLRLGAARRLIEKLILRSRQMERWDLLSIAYGNLSVCCSMGGDYSGAGAALELSIDHALREKDAESTLNAMLGVATVETARGRLERAQDALRECAPLVNAAYSQYGSLHLFLIGGELAFERARFALARQQFSSALEHCRSNLPERALIPRLWLDFLRVETGQEAEAVTLLAFSARDLAFDSDFCDLFCRTLNYQLRLQADRQDWRTAATTLALLERIVSKTGNPLWMSWLAESAAVVAHDLGRGPLAGELLARARALQLEHGFIPTPRQTASWERQQARLQHVLPRSCETSADALAEALERLQLDLVHWTHKPSMRSPPTDMPSARKLPAPAEGVSREGSALRVI